MAPYCGMKRLDYLLSEIDFSVASMDRFTASRDNVWSRTLEEAKQLLAEQNGDSESYAEANKSISALLDLASSTKHGPKARSSFRYFGQEKVRSVTTHAYEGKLPFKWICNWSSTTIQERVLQLNVMFGPLLLKRRSRLTVHIPWMFIAVLMDAICYKGASKGSWWLDHKNLQKLFGKAKSAMEKGVQHCLNDEMKSRLQGCVEVLANFIASIMSIYPEIDLLDMKEIVDDFVYHFKRRHIGRIRQLPPRPLFENSSKVIAMIDMIRRVDPLLSVEFMLFSVAQERYLTQLIRTGKFSLVDNEIGDMCRLRVLGPSSRPQERAEEKARSTGNEPSEERPQPRQNQPLEPQQQGREDRNSEVWNNVALDINIDPFLLDGLVLFSDISEAISLIRSPSNETVIGDIMNVLFEPWADTKKVNFKKLFMLSLAFMEGIDDEAVDCNMLTEGIVSRIGHDGKFIEKFARGYKNRKVGAGLEKRAPGKQVFVKLQDSSSSEDMPFSARERQSGDVESEAAPMVGTRRQADVIRNTPSESIDGRVRPASNPKATPVDANSVTENASRKRDASEFRTAENEENRSKRHRSERCDGAANQFSRLRTDRDESLDAMPDLIDGGVISDGGGRSASIVHWNPRIRVGADDEVEFDLDRDRMEPGGVSEETVRREQITSEQLATGRAGAIRRDSGGSSGKRSRKSDVSDGNCSLDELLNLTQEICDVPETNADPAPEHAVQEPGDVDGQEAVDGANEGGSRNYQEGTAGETATMNQFTRSRKEKKRNEQVMESEPQPVRRSGRQRKSRKR